jgi:hypothetical protein
MTHSQALRLQLHTQPTLAPGTQRVIVRPRSSSGGSRECEVGFLGRWGEGRRLRRVSSVFPAGVGLGLGERVGEGESEEEDSNATSSAHSSTWTPGVTDRGWEGHVAPHGFSTTGWGRRVYSLEVYFSI